MKLKNILLACVMTAGIAQADVQSNMAKVQMTAELQGIEGNKEAEIKSLVGKIGTAGFSTVAANTHIEKFYYEKYKEKGVEMISFFGMVNIDKLRTLLLANPDFGAYAPFNFLVYKTLDNKTDDNTWFGHLAPDTMLDIIGEKNADTRKEFTDMLAGFDGLVNKEMKPTKQRNLNILSLFQQKG